LVEVALIAAPSRGSEKLYGRKLLERMLLTCERAGIKQFFIRCENGEQEETKEALGSFRERSDIQFVDSFKGLTNGPHQLAASTPCIALEGNVVFARSQLDSMIDRYNAKPSQVLRLASTGGDLEGRVSMGPLGELLRNLQTAGAVTSLAGTLPYALDGHPADRHEAELRLAKALRHETTSTDGFMARLFDRKISWRISRRLAYGRITPNQVTIGNTVLGLVAATMFAVPGYWLRIVASLLFLISITIDGVDGELARLKMVESEFGGRLDKATDNLVHVAIFIGMAVGCYRASGSVTYLWLVGLLLGGFALCGLSVSHALRIKGAEAEEWISQVERATGRDFAYLLVLLAVIGHLEFFIWGTAFGTYIFASGLWLLTLRQRDQPGHRPQTN
jgi:phosphatidylglycerophosphate synthase